MELNIPGMILSTCKMLHGRGPHSVCLFFCFSEISQSSCEILFEVWDQGQKIGKSDAFMGLAIVSVSELLATASQRHVVPLQGRPYEEDKVGP